MRQIFGETMLATNHIHSDRSKPDKGHIHRTKRGIWRVSETSFNDTTSSCSSNVCVGNEMQQLATFVLFHNHLAIHNRSLTIVVVCESILY